MVTPSSANLPNVGDVIAFEYLWHREWSQGLVEGRYQRPCVVIKVDAAAEPPIVWLVPISSKEPVPGQGIELPDKVLQVLGLTKRSWIVPSDVNMTDWPGFDLRHVPEGVRPAGATWRYGRLSPALGSALSAAFQQLAKLGKVSVTPRR